MNDTFIDAFNETGIINNVTLSDTGYKLHWLDKVFSNTSLGHRLLERLTFTNLRHAFYLISPYETAVSTIDQVPNYNIEVSAWWLVFIVLEFTVLQVRGHEDRFALNDSITGICAGMLSQCFNVTVILIYTEITVHMKALMTYGSTLLLFQAIIRFSGRAVAIFLYIFVWDNFCVLDLPWDSPWTWILCLFFQDFMYYLGHRAVHEAGFFWGLHTIHHSSEYYNYSTALRQAAIQDAGLAAYDCLQAFFIPPSIFLVHRYFSEIFQFIMHTSLIGDMGPLGFVFNTPSHHRVHHGRNPYCIDKNYGGVFIIWDRMFGTFEAEREDDPPVYGLIHNEKTFDQMWLQFHTLWDMIYTKGRMKDKKGEELFPGIKNKIRAAFYPPGWFPGIPIVPFFHWYSLKDPANGVPEPERPVVKYSPPVELWIKLYLAFYFGLFLAIFFHFEYDRPKLSYLDFCLKIAFFVLTMQTYGAFFDKKWYAPYMEVVRCLGVLGFYIVLIMDHIGPGPHRVGMMTLHSIAALFWLGYIIQKAVTTRKAKVQQTDAKVTKVDMEKKSASLQTVCDAVDQPPPYNISSLSQKL